MSKVIWFLLLVGSIIVLSASAQQQNEQKIVMALKVNVLGGKEIEVVLKDSVVYLPVFETFNFLGIKANYDSSTQVLEGFFRSSDSSYSVNLAEQVATFAKNKISLEKNDLIVRGNVLYSNVSFINRLFGLDLFYNPRRVQAEIKNARRLPAVQVALRRRAYKNMALRRIFPEPDISFEREKGLFVGSRLDWTGLSRFTKSKHLGTHYNLNLGAKMLGGDLSAKVIGYTQPRSHRNDIHGNIRFPVFDNLYVRQISVGDFVNYGIFPKEVTGVEITNRPFALRRVFTREVFHGQFEPDMDIVLAGGFQGTQLQRTNETGNYILEAPIYYGEGFLEMHAYDNWGQERVSRYRMSVPRSLIPAGEAEYSFSTGRIRSPSNRFMGNTYLNWGITSEFTAGFICDYYDMRDVNNKFYPGLTATSRILNNLIFNGLFVPGAISKASLSWRFPSNAEIVLTDARYGNNSYFNPFKINQDIRGSFSLPLYLASGLIVFDFSGEQRFHDNYRNDEIQGAITGKFGAFTPRISTRRIWESIYNDGFLRVQEVSNISANINLPAGVNFIGEIEFDHLQHDISAVNVNVNKRFVSSLLVSFSLVRFPVIGYYNVGLRIEYYFPFLRAQASAITTGSQFYEYGINASGSLSFDMLEKALYFSNRANYVGYGGFRVHPFFDENSNGVYDAGEKTIDRGRLYYSNLSLLSPLNSTPIDKLVDDRTYGYDEYILTIDPQSLENPIWVPQYRNIRILSEPNHIRQINVPVVIGGFVRGTVKIADAIEIPAEGLDVVLTSVPTENKTALKFIKKATTFSTGEYELGPVSPGKYRIELNADQLSKLGYSVQPLSREVEVFVKPEGDIISDVDFKLLKR